MKNEKSILEELIDQNMKRSNIVETKEKYKHFLMSDSLFDSSQENIYKKDLFDRNMEMYGISKKCKYDEDSTDDRGYFSGGGYKK